MSERSNKRVHRREAAINAYQDLFTENIPGKTSLRNLLDKMRYTYPDFVKKAKKIGDEN